MKKFQKLALVAAIATAPMSGFAMEALEDEALSAVTGQDGVTISIASTSIGAIRVDDADAGTGLLGSDGAIWISGFSMSGATTIVVDADSDTIQAAITLGSGTMNLGSISPEAYQATSSSNTPVLTLGSMTHGDITLNVQLGAEDQTGTAAGSDMIVLAGTVGGGITLSGFSIADGSGTGSISTNLTLTDTVGTDLTLRGDINVVAAGLQIENLAPMNVTLGDLTLGGAAAIGDVSILNLQVGTVTVSGH